MNWKKLNRTLHRDLGYFFVGLTIIYSISGIALNHLHHWNPDLKSEYFHGKLSNSIDFSSDKTLAVQKMLEELGINYEVKSVLPQRHGELKAFLDVGSGNTGSIRIDTENRTFEVSILRKRKIFYEMNLMHRNNFKATWTWISDIFALALITLAITGTIILRGKYGFKRYGVWIIIAGIAIPLIIMLLNI